MSRKPNCHPLEALAGWRGFTYFETWRWLILRGWCSDHCGDIYSIASCDVDTILRAAGKRHFFPADLAPLCRRPSTLKIL